MTKNDKTTNFYKERIKEKVNSHDADKGREKKHNNADEIPKIVVGMPNEAPAGEQLIVP